MSFARNLTIDKIIAVLLSRLKMIILFTIIGGVVFYGYSKFLITPVYSTSSMVSVQNFSSDKNKSDGKGANAENQKIYGSDISGSTNLAGVCVTLFQNSDELTGLYDGCWVTISSKDFFITFSVSGSDAQKCANVANQLADKSAEVYESHYPYGKIVPVRNAKTPVTPDSPKNFQNGLIGLVVGFALSCVISVLLELIDATIKVDDDIQSVYGVPVFAEIPDFENQG